MDIALAIISIAAFVMSGVTWILAFLRNRKKIKIEVSEWSAYKIKERYRYHFHMLIENCSQLPISISGITLYADDKSYKCDIMPGFITEKSQTVGGKDVSRETTYSLPLPISISSLWGISGYLIVHTDQLILTPESREANFSVHTNRGNLLKITLSLPPIHQYIV